MLDVTTLIQSGGLLLIGFIVFAESGLFIGLLLPFPGDTLLFTAGFFAAEGKLPLSWLLLVVIIAAIIGDNVGYQVGKKYGPRVFKKENGIFFRQEHVTRATAFYEKHGGKTVVLARFLPFLRTLAPMMAGVGRMPQRRFVFYNVFGAILWGSGVTLLGYWLGREIPSIDKYLLPVVGVILIFSFAPGLYHIFKDKKTRHFLKQRIKALLKKT